MIHMKTKILIPVALGFLCAACATPSEKTQSATPSNKTVNVTFASPEKFADLKTDSMGSDKDRDYLLGEIKDYIAGRAPGRMADGQTLDIVISDIDMAGDFEPWRGPRAQDVRIIKDLYPARIDLSFKLTGADGAVVSEGARQLRDLNFMMATPGVLSNDTLRYEKTLLNDWLAREFPSSRKKDK